MVETVKMSIEDSSEWENWECPIKPYRVLFSNPDGESITHSFFLESEAREFAESIAADPRCSCLTFSMYTQTRSTDDDGNEVTSRKESEIFQLVLTKKEIGDILRSLEQANVSETLAQVKAQVSSAYNGYGSGFTA